MGFLFIFIVLSLIVFGFAYQKHGGYYKGLFIMKNDYKHALILFENAYKFSNLKCKAYYRSAMCYENIGKNKDEDQRSNLSNAFLSYFMAIYYSKENNNYKILQKSRDNMQELYYFFNQKEKEENLNRLFSLYFSNFYLPRYLSILNNDLNNMYKDFEKIDNIHFKLFRKYTK